MLRGTRVTQNKIGERKSPWNIPLLKLISSAFNVFSTVFKTHFVFHRNACCARESFVKQVIVGTFLAIFRSMNEAHYHRPFCSQSMLLTGWSCGCGNFQGSFCLLVIDYFNRMAHVCSLFFHLELGHCQWMNMKRNEYVYSVKINVKILYIVVKQVIGR